MRSFSLFIRITRHAADAWVFVLDHPIGMARCGWSFRFVIQINFTFIGISKVYAATTLFVRAFGASFIIETLRMGNPLGQ